MYVFISMYQEYVFVHLYRPKDVLVAIINIKFDTISVVSSVKSGRFMTGFTLRRKCEGLPAPHCTNSYFKKRSRHYLLRICKSVLSVRNSRNRSFVSNRLDSAVLFVSSIFQIATVNVGLR